MPTTNYLKVIDCEYAATNEEKNFKKRTVGKTIKNRREVNKDNLYKNITFNNEIQY